MKSVFIRTKFVFARCNCDINTNCVCICSVVNSNLWPACPGCQPVLPPSQPVHPQACGMFLGEMLCMLAFWLTACWRRSAILCF